MPAQSERGPIALVILIGALWGFNWPAVRIALGEFQPWTLRAMSLIAAAALLMLIGLMQHHPLRLRARDWWRVAVPGITGIAGVNILNAFAQMNMSTGRTAVVTFSMPIWATLLAIVFLSERLDRRKTIGLVLGAAGLVVLGLPIIEGGRVTYGLALAFASALCWAVSIVFMKRYPLKAPPVIAAAWQVGCGGAVLFVGMLLFEGWPKIEWHLSPGLLGLIYNTVLAQALGTFLWFRVLARSSAGIAAIGTLMVPAVGMIGAVILLGERPPLTDWIGLVLVLAASASVLIPPVRRGRFGARTAAPVAPAPEG